MRATRRYSCQTVVAKAVLKHLDELGHRGARGPWSPQVRLSDVAECIAWDVVLTQWPRMCAAEALTRRAEPTAHQRACLVTLVHDFWDHIHALCQFGRSVSEAAQDQLLDQGGLRRTPGQLSEKLTRLLAANYRESGGQLPTEDEIPTLVNQLITKVCLLPPPMDQQTFADLTIDRYDLQWDEVGASNWLRNRPSAIGLGPDKRPPCLAPTGDVGLGGWGLGSARSLYDRYTLHHSLRAYSQPSTSDDERRPVPASSEERVEEEIVRTCSSYGLAGTTHRQILYSIAVGAEVPDGIRRQSREGQPPRGAWRSWIVTADAPAGPDTIDGGENLIDAVRDRFDLWYRQEEVSRLQEQQDSLANHADTIARAVVRKVWMDLHRREREFVQPARRLDVRRSLNTALNNAVPEALKKPGFVTDRVVTSPDVGSPTVVRDVDSRVGQAADAQLADYAVRYGRTVELLVEGAADRLVLWHAAALTHDEEDWQQNYLALLATQGNAMGFLTAQELAEAFREPWGEW